MTARVDVADQIAAWSSGAAEDPRMLALLDRHPGRHLIVEITEHAIINDYTSLQTTPE